jgi:hypothetical protein
MKPKYYRLACLGLSAGTVIVLAATVQISQLNSAAETTAQTTTEMTTETTIEGSLYRSVQINSQATGGKILAAVCGATEKNPQPLTELNGQPVSSDRYWADPTTSNILRADACGAEPGVVAEGLNIPYGLAYDDSTQSLIWTSSGDGVVQKLVLGSTFVENLLTSFDTPPAIETERNKQAITVLGNDVVQITRNPETGEETSKVLMSVNAAEPVHGMAMDAKTRQLYLGNAVGMMSYKLSLADNAVTRLTFTDHNDANPVLVAGDIK